MNFEQLASARHGAYEAYRQFSVRGVTVSASVKHLVEAVRSVCEFVVTNDSVLPILADQVSDVNALAAKAVAQLPGAQAILDASVSGTHSEEAQFLIRQAVPNFLASIV